MTSVTDASLYNNYAGMFQQRTFYRPVYKPILSLPAVAEPPTCLAISVAFAIREAIVSSREETGYPRNKWFSVGKKSIQI